MRSIPDPGFADDDGGADPVVAAALAAYDGAGQADESSAHLEALAVLQDSRVLVPVVAILDEMDDTPRQGVGAGLPREKSSDMAAVLMTGRDGRTALLAFTSTSTLDRWAKSYAGGEARPVPVPARQAASAALQDQATALLLDVAGPVLFVVEGEDLDSLAAGHRLVRLESRWAWVTGP
jgi:hypothetical protein